MLRNHDDACLSKSCSFKKSFCRIVSERKITFRYIIGYQKMLLLGLRPAPPTHSKEPSPHKMTLLQQLWLRLCLGKSQSACCHRYLAVQCPLTWPSQWVTVPWWGSDLMSPCLLNRLSSQQQEMLTLQKPVSNWAVSELQVCCVDFLIIQTSCWQECLKDL